MHGIFGAYAVGVALLAALCLIYWTRRSQIAEIVRQRAAALRLLALCTVGCVLLLWSAWLDGPQYSFERSGNPVAIAIAFDLSPSMLAIPDPGRYPEVLPRYARGKQRVIELLNRIEGSGTPAVISLVGFTKDASIIMAWNQNVAEVREITGYAIVPGLFGSSGTSLEAAAEVVTDVFELLPERVGAKRRIAILVSDGEDTMRAASVGYAAARLADSQLKLIGLQTGLLDTPEGIPVYNELGDFLGFQPMGGEVFTRPDAAIMSTVVHAEAGNNLLLQAQNPDAAERMFSFVLGGQKVVRQTDSSVLPALGLFLVLFIFMALHSR